MTLYSKIANTIQEEILSGYYDLGNKLPTIKEQTERFECSVGTVVKAYDVLIQKKVIYAKDRSGFYVSNNFTKGIKRKTTLHDFSTGNPNFDSFAIHQARNALDLALDIYREDELRFLLKGSDSLIDLMKDDLERFDIYANRENIYLAQGVTQVLTLLCKMDFPNGRQTILIEEPTYRFTNKLSKEFDFDIVTVERTEEGIDIEALERIFQTHQIKFFYTIPRNHNPLGTYLSLSNRKQIMRLAHLYGVYVVEDDYFADSFEIPQYAPLFYYSNFKNCIYIKSYSKLLPYIRIGVAVVPDSLLECYQTAVQRAYYNSYYMPDLISQATLEASIRSSILEKNARELSDKLAQKIETLNSITKRWDPEIVKRYDVTSGPYSIYRVNPCINLNRVIENLKKKKIHVSLAHESYYHPEKGKHIFRLGLSRIDNQDIPYCLEEIYKELMKSFTENKGISNYLFSY